MNKYAYFLKQNILRFIIVLPRITLGVYRGITSTAEVISTNFIFPGLSCKPEYGKMDPAVLTLGRLPMVLFKDEVDFANPDTLFML